MLLSKKKERKAGTRAKKATRKKKVKRKVRKRARTKVRKRAKRVKRAKPQKKTIKKVPKIVKGKEAQIGTVTHYFPHVKAGAITIKKGTLAIGETIRIKGHTTDFKQKIRSLQIDRAPIQEGSVGDEVGILVKSRVRINDKVFKVK